MNLSKLKYPLSTLPIRLLDGVVKHIPSPTPVRFVIEKGNWSIKWDGLSIVNGVNHIIPNLASVTTKPYLLSNKVVHFGSQFQSVSWTKHMAQSNRMICTFFHGKKQDDAGMARHVDEFLESVPHLDKVVTAATLIEKRLLEWGVPRHKLVRIPIGIDCQLFKPFTTEQKLLARQRYGIKPDQLVVGSFQKDGNGWGEGLDPKMIKGPDILVKVAKELSKHSSILVFLTGPARGYVKKNLDDLGIPYIHEYLDNYLDLPSRFAPLDVYINPSREEGGPKGILEAMASGIFVVSTKVGMAPDVIEHHQNGALADIEDSDGIVQSILWAQDYPDDVSKIIFKARQDILAYDWANIAKAHYEDVYKGLI